MFEHAGTGRSQALGSARSVETMLETVARRLEAERPGSRFPLLQLLRREGPLSSLECGALVFEVARLRVLLSAVSLASAREDEVDAFPRVDGPHRAATLADAYARPLGVIDHFARLAAASGDGARITSRTGAPPASSASPSPVPARTAG